MATSTPLSRVLDHPMRITATVIAGLALTLSAVLPGSAGADALSDAKARAAQISGQLSQLNTQLEISSTSSTTRPRSTWPRPTPTSPPASTSWPRPTRSSPPDTAQLRSYAVQAYVEGDDAPSLEAVLTSEGNSATERKGYLEAAAGNRQDLIDHLSATRQQANAQLGQLNAARDSAAKLADQLASSTQQERATLAQENALHAQVTGQIATLVAQQQAAQAAAEAKAAAAAKSAAQAAAAKATAAPTVTKAAPHTGGGTSSPPPGSNTFVPPPGGGAGAAVAAAESQIGVPYVWAGATPGRAFDCSGLTMWAWSQGGVSLPHSAQGQYNMSTHISQSQLQPGDLVFFGSSTGSIGHVGIYVGGGTMVHAPHTGATVTYQSIGYWAGEGMWFGRV